ncbi:Tyramine beta-hydroxylase [Biomphalaria glabrata]|nr:MOXD1-like protein 1-like [Biomphalaria glabrata]
MAEIKTLRCLTFPLVWNHAFGYMLYQTKIPNGDSVPHPCKTDTKWQGVGHFIDAGTGLRNAFGLDFAAEGHKWTSTLCHKDSDGDGMTNGQELGDPNCTWTETSTPYRVTGLTHPGICDPWESPSCLLKTVTHSLYKTQGDWLHAICKAGDFVCPGINETGVQNLTVRLDNTSVPAKVTTYICQYIDLVKEIGSGNFHLIAAEPIIDNANVLHHMILFGCNDSLNIAQGPFECGMTASQYCQDLLITWTVGLAGDCSHPMTGIRLGQTGYKKIAIQLHWNNPFTKSDWTDSSGLRIYYTPNLRTYDAGIWITGSNYFVLPPKLPSVTVTSTCTKGCTRNVVTGPVNITKALNHMHYAGKQMSIEVLRDGSHYLYLTNEPIFVYDSPQVYLYTDEVITLQAGDELITRCTFTTANRNTTTFQGQATLDEMCYGFLTYYPAQNLKNKFCLTEGPDVSLCDTQTAQDHGCPILSSKFVDLLYTSGLSKQLEDKCMLFSPCKEECKEFLVPLMQSNKCFQGELFEYIKGRILTRSYDGRQIMARLSSCEKEIYSLLSYQSNPISSTDTSVCKASRGTQLTSAVNNSASFFIIVYSFAFLIFLNQ